jgi:hypothetical protein
MTTLCGFNNEKEDRTIVVDVIFIGRHYDSSGYGCLVGPYVFNMQIIGTIYL